MKSIILLNHNENTKQVEAEEKSKFLKELLEKMGIEVSEFWDDDTILLSVDQKIKLRNILTTYAIKVIDDLDGHMQIFVEGELVGEWNKCIYKLKQDLSEIDKKKQFFLEMEVNCWTLFEQQEI